MKLEALIVPLELDDSEYKQNLDEAKQSGQQFSTQLGSGMMKGGAAMAAAGAPFALFARDAVGSASELLESIGGVEAVFGDASSTVFAFGEDAAQATGLAKSAYNQASLEIGAMVMNMGLADDEAATLTGEALQRSADIGARLNSDAGEVSASYQSAMAGNIMSARRFGIDMSMAAVEATALNMGLIEQGEELEGANLALARHNTFMEQSAVHSGAFADEAEGVAGQSKIMNAEFENLKTELGTEMLPIIQELLGHLKAGITWFKGLNPEVKKGAAVFALLMASLVVIGPIIAGVGLLIGAVGLPIFALILAVGALVATWLIFKDRFLGTLETIRWGVTTIFKAIGDRIREKVEEWKTKILETWQAIKDGIEKAIEDIKAFIENMIPDIKIPEWLQKFIPDSPTPFEIGIRGIDRAVSDLDLRASLAPDGGPESALSYAELERLVRRLPDEIALAMRPAIQARPAR